MNNEQRAKASEIRARGQSKLTMNNEQRAKSKEQRKKKNARWLKVNAGEMKKE